MTTTTDKSERKLTEAEIAGVEQLWAELAERIGGDNLLRVQAVLRAGRQNIGSTRLVRVTLGEREAARKGITS